jgi:hypothetical protein
LDDAMLPPPSFPRPEAPEHVRDYVSQQQQQGYAAIEAASGYNSDAAAGYYGDDDSDASSDDHEDEAAGVGAGGAGDYVFVGGQQQQDSYRDDLGQENSIEENYSGSNVNLGGGVGYQQNDEEQYGQQYSNPQRQPDVLYGAPKYDTLGDGEEYSGGQGKKYGKKVSTGIFFFIRKKLL